MKKLITVSLLAALFGVFTVASANEAPAASAKAVVVTKTPQGQTVTEEVVISEEAKEVAANEEAVACEGCKK